MPPLAPNDLTTSGSLTFLTINGFEIEDEKMELYEAMIAIAEKRMSKEDLAQLFEKLTS